MSVAERLVLEFSEEAARRDWSVAFFEDDELIVFERRLGADLWAELGLDLTEQDYGLSLNPSLSVRHQIVSELYSQFFGFDDDGGPVAQIGRSLSGLIYEAGDGRAVMWTVEGTDEIAPVTQKVLADVEKYGDPFFRRHDSLDDLIRGMERLARSNLDYAHLAVAYKVAGDSLKTASSLRRLEELAESDPPLLAAQTRRFLAAFRAHFGTGVE